MLRLLVVDDEPDILATVGQGLPLVMPGGVEVRLAGSGEEGKAILDSDPSIDVVLCDARMPGMSGLELLKWMRHAGHRARRVLLSAYSPKIFPEQEIRDAQPDAIYVKPLNLRELARSVSAPRNGNA